MLISRKLRCRLCGRNYGFCELIAFAPKIQSHRCCQHHFVVAVSEVPPMPLDVSSVPLPLGLLESTLRLHLLPRQALEICSRCVREITKTACKEITSLHLGLNSDLDATLGLFSGTPLRPRQQNLSSSPQATQIVYSAESQRASSLYSRCSPPFSIRLKMELLLGRAHSRWWVRLQLDFGFKILNSKIEIRFRSHVSFWHLLSFL